MMKNISESPKTALHQMECFMALKNNIQYLNKTKYIKNILITSTKDGEGKTTIATNLAVVLANEGKKVLIIDGNFCSPGVKELLNPNNAFCSPVTNEANTYITETPVKNLYMSCLHEYIGKYLDPLQLNDIFNTFKDNFDFTIIDSPSAVHLSIVQTLSQYSDGCILVIKPGEAAIDEAKKFKEQLTKLNTNIIGAVLNENISNYCTEEYMVTNTASQRSKKNHKRLLKITPFEI